jgi:4-amino-4-deoxy-L-arabinose transferase-like glycosyltransferase
VNLRPARWGAWRLKRFGRLRFPKYEQRQSLGLLATLRGRTSPRKCEKSASKAQGAAYEFITVLGGYARYATRIAMAQVFVVKHQHLVLGALVAVAFLTRLGVRLAFGEHYFWTNSYFEYYELAENIAAGRGFCTDSGCAWLPPLYPLFLTFSVLSGKSYLLVIVPQALMGAGTAFIAFLIGRHIFSVFTGILACAITALYPYYVMHDTALQDTGMVTFCIALSMWLLLRASRLNRNSDWLLAGLALGTIALTRASGPSVIGVALLWTIIWGSQGDGWERLRKTSILLLATIVTVGPWLIETYRLTGAPVISSQTGHALWMGNNPETFSHYPEGSIDRSTDEASLKLTPADRAELDQLASDEIAKSDWFKHRALNFIKATPWSLLVQRAVRKLEAGFSWRLNPNREFLVQAAYGVTYVPVAVLGVIGMILVWRKREVILFEMLLLSFMAVTAVYWAHTSHRIYLDVYLIVFAASVMEKFGATLKGSVLPLRSFSRS